MIDYSCYSAVAKALDPESMVSVGRVQPRFVADPSFGPRFFPFVAYVGAMGIHVVCMDACMHVCMHACVRAIIDSFCASSLHEIDRLRGSVGG